MITSTIELPQRFQKNIASNSVLILLLGLGLIHGLIYLFLVPPWQHYDEPTHFEYASLIADLRHRPDLGVDDSLLRREIASSMIENHFFDKLDFVPNLLAKGDSLWIGVSQLSDPPGYYLAVSLPMMLTRGSDVTDQLYLARFLSLLFYLGTITASYFLVRELFPSARRLAWLVPLLIVLLPAFTDLMNSVSNDVGIIFCFTLFLLAGIRLVMRGYSIRGVLFLLITGMVCISVKSVGWFSIPLIILLFLLRPLMNSQAWRIGTLAVLSGLIIIGFIGLFLNLDPAGWYRRNLGHSISQTYSTSRLNSVFGRKNLEITSPPVSGSQATVFQPLSPTLVQQLRGKWVTLGGWVWSDQPRAAESPAIWIDGVTHTQMITVDNTPSFFAVHTKVNQEANQIQVNLMAPPDNAGSSGAIHFDGLILAIGNFPVDEVPRVEDESIRTGTWGSRQFENLILNPSFEKLWMTVPEGIDRPLSSLTNINLNYVLSTIQDWNSYKVIYRIVGSNLFQSFWARFGWNQIKIPSIGYWLLLVFSISGWIGSLGWLKENRPVLNPNQKIAIAWLLLTTILIWIAAVFRVDFPFWGKSAFIPSARYAYPAIVPTMLLLAVGWLWILSRFFSRRLGVAILIAFFLILDSASLAAIVKYYWM